MNRLRRLQQVVAQFVIGHPPADLPPALKLEWMIVPIRWMGLVTVVAVFAIFNSDPKLRLASILVSLPPTLYNPFIRRRLKRKPYPVHIPYITNSIESLLTVVLVKM